MKVDKQKFLDAISYIREVNSYELEDLDLSEFFDEYVIFKFDNLINIEREETETILKTKKEAIQDWMFTGLDNKDFILTHFMREINESKNN